jgi:hypothetical protein
MPQGERTLGSIRDQEYPQGYRGFESLALRQTSLVLPRPRKALGTRCVPSFTLLGTPTRIVTDSWYTVRSTLWALDRGSGDGGS